MAQMFLGPRKYNRQMKSTYDKSNGPEGCPPPNDCAKVAMFDERCPCNPAEPIGMLPNPHVGLFAGAAVQ